MAARVRGVGVDLCGFLVPPQKAQAVRLELEHGEQHGDVLLCVLLGQAELSGGCFVQAAQRLGEPAGVHQIGGVHQQCLGQQREQRRVGPRHRGDDFQDDSGVLECVGLIAEQVEAGEELLYRTVVFQQ